MSFEIHDKGFWINSNIEGHCFDSALCDAIAEYLKRRSLLSVVDLGCGPGSYVKGLRDKGFAIEGYDGNPHTVQISGDILNDGTHCGCVDLTERIQFEKSFDCVLSLEVGEHIPAHYEKIFLENITANTKKTVILSWAVEGQTGDGHVNCRSNDYIISRLENIGFAEDIFGKNYFRLKASLPWFKHSIMVFQRKNNVKDISQVACATDNLREMIAEKIMLLVEVSYSAGDIGLYKGKTGILLALYKITDSLTEINKPIIKDTISYLQEEIAEQAGSTDDTFAQGLFGIGWGIVSLYEQGLIRENETEVLNSFDDELYKLVMYSKAATHSLDTGTTGRIHYFLKRIPESLKLSNKYRYVCNYEILMLLVDDFTNANENIIIDLQGNATINYLKENDLGEILSHIFTLLGLLVKECIHKEITERQWLQLLKYFLAVYENENSLPDENDRDAQLNRLFVYNNLLKCALESKTITNKLNYEKVVCAVSFKPQTVQEIVLYKSYLKNINRCFGKQPYVYKLEEEIMNEDMGFGIDGLSGLVCLLAEDVYNAGDTLMEKIFLI